MLCSQLSGAKQGCQMVYFQTKNPNLGKFWRVLQWKMLVYQDHLEHFPAIWYIYFMALWYMLWSFGIFSPFWYIYREKSGNPGGKALFREKSF
jgi:hypothetical protein